MQSRDTGARLRGSLDINDSFARGGHGVISAAGGNTHTKRMKNVPAWALDDNKIKELVLRSYPGLKQRKQAAKRVRILYLYYRVGCTAAFIAHELKMTDNAVEMVIKRVKKVAACTRPRGRSKLNKDLNIDHSDAHNEAANNVESASSYITDSKGFNAN
jgi:hypothetical protein